MSVSYDVRNGVAWLTVDRPAARNALNKSVRDGLFDYLSADAQEGMQAFKEKRSPHWKGA